MKIIETVNLTKTYKQTAAINNINLQIEAGDFYGFIGPNGAGKSTTIKCLLNLIFPTSGTIKIFDKDSITENKAIKQSVGYVSSDVRFYSEMTVQTILNRVIDFHKIIDGITLAEYYYQLFDINPLKKMAELSLGNKKKVALVAALMPNPKLLILDEPSSGLDPLMQHRLFEELIRKNKQGMTIFLSSHDLLEIQKYCTKAAFIREGKIIAVEDIAEQISTHKVIEIKTFDFAFLTKLANLITILERSEHHVRFIYHADIAELFPLLATLNLTDITITAQSLEDKFLSLYEGGTEDGTF